MKKPLKKHHQHIVYALTSDGDEYLKIGRTKNIRNRLNNIQSGCPFRLTILRTFKTETPRECENYLLTNLSHCHLRGEWFKPSEEDITFILDHFDLKISQYRKVMRGQ